MTTRPDLSVSLQFRGILLVTLSGMLYGFMGYFGTQLFYQQFSVATMLFWRFFIAALWMFGLLLLRKEKNTMSLNFKHLAQVIGFGVISYTGASFFYFLASKQIGTGAAMVIFFLYPVFVAFFAWTLNNAHINKATIISLAMVIFGLVFLKGTGQTLLSIQGISIAVVAAFFYAIYVFSSQYSIKLVDAYGQTLWVCLGNALIFFVISLANHQFIFPTTLTAWMCVFAIGIIATALPIHLLLDGLKYVSPIKASILSVLEPVVTILMGVALLHESLSPMQFLGIAIILCGAIAIQFDNKLPEEGETCDIEAS